MLLRIIPLIFIVSLLTVTMLNVVAMTARVIAHQRALAYVAPAYQAALADFEQAFASGTYVAPGPAAATCISNDSPCSFYSSASITLSTQTAPQATASCSSAANCAQNLEAHPVVAEGRVSARITIAVSDSRQMTLVTRTRFLTARTFSVAPYVAIVGERDGTISDRSTASEGENAGKQQQTASDGSITRASTRIAVKYHDQTGAKADIDNSRYSTQGWTNGNTSTAAWSP